MRCAGAGGEAAAGVAEAIHRAVANGSRGSEECRVQFHARDGRLRLDVATGVAFATVRFGDYLDVLERGERPDAYLIEPGSTWIPELLDDVRVPEYCRDASWRNTRFWLSAADTGL